MPKLQRLTSIQVTRVTSWQLQENVKTTKNVYQYPSLWVWGKRLLNLPFPFLPQSGFWWCRFYRCCFYPLPFLPLPFLPVAHFTVALFTGCLIYRFRFYLLPEKQIIAVFRWIMNALWHNALLWCQVFIAQKLCNKRHSQLLTVNSEEWSISDYTTSNIRGRGGRKDSLHRPCKSRWRCSASATECEAASRSAHGIRTQLSHRPPSSHCRVPYEWSAHESRRLQNNLFTCELSANNIRTTSNSCKTGVVTWSRGLRSRTDWALELPRVLYCRTLC